MKRLLIFFTAISLFTCKEEDPKDYATISGKIENANNNDTLRVFQGNVFEKIITLNEDGTFEDTLKVAEGDYTFQYGNEYGQIYLKNDNVSSFNTDNESFIDSMEFSGDGSDINNFSLKSFLISKTHFTEDLIANGTEEDLKNALKAYQDDYEAIKNKYSEIDSTRVAKMDQNIKNASMQLQRFMSMKLATRNAFPKGSPSPSFENYENFAGGTMSLSDLKGKYVYFDIWATWCGPCIKEIPSLKKVEEQYKDKNIEFVSISVDEGRGYKGDKDAAYEGWKKMVADKDLGGIQLMADNGFTSTFIRDYKINSIPRFLLIDPDGNIVNADAPRPSSKALVSLFDELGI